MAWMALVLDVDVDGLLNVHHEAIDVHTPEREQFFELLVPVEAVVVLDLRDVIAFQIVILDLLSVQDLPRAQGLLGLLIHLLTLLVGQFGAVLG